MQAIWVFRHLGRGSWLRVCSRMAGRDPIQVWRAGSAAALAAGTVVIVSLTSVRGTPPFLIYLLATLPLGVAAIFHARVLMRAVT